MEELAQYRVPSWVSLQAALFLQANEVTRCTSAGQGRAGSAAGSCFQGSNHGELDIILQSLPSSEFLTLQPFAYNKSTSQKSANSSDRLSEFCGLPQTSEGNLHVY